MTTFWTFLFFCVLCATVVRVMTLRMKDDKHRIFGGDDTETMQEIHRGLQRMEERVEALETLLMDRTRDRRTHVEVE